MEDLVFLICSVLILILIIIANIIYFSKILPILRKYNKNTSLEVLPSKLWEQLKEFNRVCKENNLPNWFGNFIIFVAFILPITGLVLFIINAILYGIK